MKVTFKVYYQHFNFRNKTKNGVESFHLAEVNGSTGFPVRGGQPRRERHCVVRLCVVQVLCFSWLFPLCS